MLVPVFAGIIVGLVAFGSFMDYLLINHTLPTMTFFIGLIIGIVPAIIKNVKRPGEKYRSGGVALIGIPFLFVIVVGGLSGSDAKTPAETIRTMGIPYMLVLLLAGILAAAALVIPGVSGSFMLLLVGVYPIATHALASVRELFTGADAELFLDVFKVLAPLGIGVIIGGLAMCRLIDGLFRRHFSTTYSIILGLLLGSIYDLMRWHVVSQIGVQTPVIVLSVLLCAAGFFLSFVLGKKRF